MESNQDFRLFKRTYRDRHTGDRTETDNWYIEFRDHLNVRHRWPAFTSERQSHKLAERILELVGLRRSGEPLTEKQSSFIETMAEDLRDRLIEATIIDRRYGMRGGPLLPHLEGAKDAEGKIDTPGYKQALEAKGNTADHVALTIQRARRIIDECCFATVADLRRPAAVTEIQVFLGKLREKGELNGAGYNTYVRCIGAFLRWMVKDGRMPNNPLASLDKVNNTDIDKNERRELQTDEMRWLLQITLNEGLESFGLAAADRERLYRFAYQTGMRPGQIRGLTKASFNLDGDCPSVTARAQTVKRRKAHTQSLTAEMAAELKGLFETMMPTASAFRLPSKYNLARMLQRDMKAAREAWIEAAPAGEERAKRRQSDFLADVDHQGARADFYSLRHSHGSALADAGVPQKDVQASMHHTSGRTTERYMHTRQHSIAAAIAKLPSIKPAILLATGTDGKAKIAAPSAAPTTRPSAAFGDSKAGSGEAGHLANCSENRDSASPDGEEHVAQLVEQRTFNPLTTSQNPLENKGNSTGQSSAAPPAGPTPTPAHPELAEIARSWDRLPAAVKAGIMAMVRAAQYCGPDDHRAILFALRAKWILCWSAASRQNAGLKFRTRSKFSDSSGGAWAGAGRGCAARVA